MVLRFQVNLIVLLDITFCFHLFHLEWVFQPLHIYVQCKCLQIAICIFCRQICVALHAANNKCLSVNYADMRINIVRPMLTPPNFQNFLLFWAQAAILPCSYSLLQLDSFSAVERKCWEKLIKRIVKIKLPLFKFS